MICFSVITTVIVCSGNEQFPAGKVLFDEAHGQKFLVNDTGPLGLSGLAAVFSRQGFSLSTNSAPLDQQTLADIDILVISGSFVPYSSGEISAIQKFLSEG
ncbi:MAG: hypothetical protein AMJ60_04460, partial [Desulfobacterales bacterium SG8_35]